VRYRSFILFVLAICLGASAGCKSPRPELKPGKSADHFVDPPRGQYESPDYPRQAMDNSEYPPKAPTAVNRNLVPTGGIGSTGNAPYGPYKF
jgi:hypothetical protein